MKFFMIFCACIIFSACSESKDTSYLDWQEAKDDGAFSRGWLPVWMPKSASKITETHDIDTNEVSFSFELAEAFTPPQFCEERNHFPKPDLIAGAKKNVDKHHQAVLYCDGFYIYAAGNTVVGWKPPS